MMVTVTLPVLAHLNRLLAFTVIVIVTRWQVVAGDPYVTRVSLAGGLALLDGKHVICKVGFIGLFTWICKRLFNDRVPVMPRRSVTPNRKCDKVD